MHRSVWILILLLSLAGEVFSKSWNGIVPCVSTRSGAERILGKEDLEIEPGTYLYQKFRAHIRYDQTERNSPQTDIVERIDVFPDESISLAKFIKKIPHFQKQFVKTALEDRLSHVRGRAVYRNRDEGFETWVKKNGEGKEIINNFGYFDPAGDCSKHPER